MPTQNIRFDRIGDRLQNPYVKAGALAFVALALGFAAMYWVFYIRPEHAAPVARKNAETQLPKPVLTPQQQPDVVALAPVPADSGKAEAPRPAPVRPDPPRAEPSKAAFAKPEPAKSEPAKAEPPKAESTRVGTDGKVIKFRFKGDSWVEIRDKRGRVLLSKLNPAGSEAEVAGQPPFNVIVGNAPEVRVFYNDHEFDLEPHTKVAVARFTVE